MPLEETRVPLVSGTATLRGDDDFTELQIDTADSHQLKYKGDRTNRTVVNTDQAQTLTNKTLTSPIISEEGIVITADDGDTVILHSRDQSIDGRDIYLPNIATNAELGIVCATRVRFDATDGHDAAVGTSTGTIRIPSGSVLLDLLVHNRVLWDAGTSTTMNVGDENDDDGYFAAIDLQATDFLVGEVLSLMHGDLWGGLNGVYLVAASGRRGPNTGLTVGTSYGTNTDIQGTVTTVGTTPTVGTTDLTAIYVMPGVRNATYVAT